MKKKVFDLDTFVGDCWRWDENYDSAIGAISCGWPITCDGMTTEEMTAMDYVNDDHWCKTIEVADVKATKPMPYTKKSILELLKRQRDVYFANFRNPANSATIQHDYYMRATAIALFLDSVKSKKCFDALVEDLSAMDEVK